MARQEAFDTSRTMEIAISRWKMWGLVAMGGAMTGVCGAIALGLIGQPDGFILFLGWFGVLFFGLALFSATRSVLTLRGPVVTLSPQGIRDVRIGNETIPWNRIVDISTWSNRHQKMMVLKPDAELDRNFARGVYARWMRRANRKFGADGICITAQGLKTSHARLLAASMAY